MQRPDAQVLTGQIKNNIPVRISGRFADKAASEIVLGNTDAVDLPDIKGRFLYKVGNETLHFQAFYFDDETMLHDVFTEQGDMLLEAPSYRPDTGQIQTVTPATVPNSFGETSVHKEKTKKSRYLKKSARTEKTDGQEYADQNIGLSLNYDFGELEDEEPLPF